MKDLHKGADKSPKGEKIKSMSMMNPLTKFIMQDQNLTGKATVGVYANGEQLFYNLEMKCGYVSVQDKFGDYGLISVVVLDKMPSDTLFISEWLMSCRVLKRGVEEFIMDQIVELARKNGFQTVTAEYPLRLTRFAAAVPLKPK